MAEPERSAGPSPEPASLTAILGAAGGTGGPDLDRLIHERVRLGIVSALAVNERLTFNDLKALLGVTDGNLSSHARKLEDGGYIDCSKGYEGRVPRTDFSLTAAGRAAFEEYLSHMETLIRVVREEDDKDE